ncbi:hypothetical protein L1887_55397 [Cichorium endivia]|nr:hypothetical protein L1887_55397 [Cichorium endivia]
MEQCRQGKSAKWIRNLGKRIGSEGWARGSPVPNPSAVGGLLELLPRRERVAACRPGDGLGTGSFGGPSPGVEQPTQNCGAMPLFLDPRPASAGRSGPKKTLSGGRVWLGAAHLLKDNAVRIRTVKAWPNDPLDLRNLKLEVSEKSESGLEATRVPAACLPTSSRGLGPQRHVSLAKPVRRMSRAGRHEVQFHQAAGRILCRRLKYATGYCKWQSGLAATIH